MQPVHENVGKEDDEKAASENLIDRVGCKEETGKTGGASSQIKASEHGEEGVETEGIQTEGAVEKSSNLTAGDEALEGQTEQQSVDAPQKGVSELAQETARLWHDTAPVPDCAVIWLHGFGETEIYWQEHFADLMKLHEVGDCRWIMPRADMSACTARLGALTFQWFDTPELPVSLLVRGVPDRPRKDESSDEIYNAVRRVHEAIIALEVEGVPTERIVVAGFCQGGALAVHSVLSYPKTLAGGAMLCGYLPCLSELENKATPEGRLAEVLWLHGIRDGVVLPDAAVSQAKRATELGVKLDFRLSFDLGHETNSDELHQVFRSWLVAKLSKPGEEISTARDEAEDAKAADDAVAQ
mmetsp:Transcript_41061/g.64182  ORF Transcript_41061/g.64182 Transcript_41061/m.64182 type:complete len:355 (+) Transcript_41061:27-1091(+)